MSIVGRLSTLQSVHYQRFHSPSHQATGIMEMRQAVEEKEDAKSLKQKTRERVRPKMGKLTIDYQKLHDAFFRLHTSSV